MVRMHYKLFMMIALVVSAQLVVAGGNAMSRSAQGYDKIMKRAQDLLVKYNIDEERQVVLVAELRDENGTVKRGLNPAAFDHEKLAVYVYLVAGQKQTRWLKREEPFGSFAMTTNSLNNYSMRAERDFRVAAQEDPGPHPTPGPTHDQVQAGLKDALAKIQALIKTYVSDYERKIIRAADGAKVSGIQQIKVALVEQERELLDDLTHTTFMLDAAGIKELAEDIKLLEDEAGRTLIAIEPLPTPSLDPSFWQKYVPSIIRNHPYISAAVAVTGVAAGIVFMYRDEIIEMINDEELVEV